MNLSLNSVVEQQKIRIRERFAANLKKLRVAKGMTQTQLAECVNVPRSSYNAFETARNAPHLQALVRLADVLNVTLDELVGRNRH